MTDKKTAAGIKAKSSREVICLDGDGDEIHRAVFADASSLQRLMEEALRKYGPRTIAWAAPGAKRAEGDKRPMLTAFVDDKKDSADTLKALEDRRVAKLHPRFLFVRATFKADSEEARKWGVTQAPTLVAADAAKGEALEKVSGRKGPPELKAFLLKALARAEKK